MKAVDLFCGAGGASLGLVQAGCEVVGAVDAYEEALDTYESNLCDGEITDDLPGTVAFDEPLEADLSRGYDDNGQGGELPEVTFEDIRDHFGIEEGEVDIICGCPPCQNFSSLRDTDPWPDGKPKDGLLRAFVDFIREEVPQIVLFENVSNIINAGEDVPTTYVDWLVRQMEEITKPDDDQQEGGYGHALDILNAANYGVPQRRERTIGIFVYGVDNEAVTLPIPTHAENPAPEEELEEWESVGDHIYLDNLKTDLNLGEKQVGVDNYPDDPAQRSRRHHDSTIEMVEAIRKHGDSWRDLKDTDDEHLIKDCHQNLSGGAASAYGIMSKEEPCGTLTTRCTNISSGRFTHPTQNRAITFREAALLMGFPRWFELPDTNKHAERVVGNAVPPELLRVVADYAVENYQRTQALEV